MDESNLPSAEKVRVQVAKEPHLFVNTSVLLLRVRLVQTGTVLSDVH